MLGKFVHRQFFKALALFVGADIHHALGIAVQQLLHVGQHGVAVAGAGHHVRLGDGGSLLGERLRIAARQHGDGAGVLALGAAQPFAAFLVAEIGHGAAVHHIHVRRLIIRHHGVAVCLKQLLHSAGFVLVDLAAQGIKCYPHKYDPFL